MSLKSAIDGYTLEIVARAIAGEQRCKRLVGAEFASEAPRNLAQALLNVFQYIAKVAPLVAADIDWSGTAAEVEKDITVLRVLDAELKDFAADIRYVESALTDRLPWHIIPSFEELVADLRPRVQVMLRPMWRYNYATLVSDLRDIYLSQLQVYEYYLPSVDVESTIVAPLGVAFHIISFPALERDNILLHSVIGHEIGHLFATELIADLENAFLNEATPQIEAATDDELSRNKIEDQVGPLMFPRFRAQRIADNSKTCLTYWARALEEIFADTVGAILFGPAALFSTLDIALQSGFDLPPRPTNNFYPPWRTRLREVLRVVDRTSGSMLSVERDLFKFDTPLALASRAKELGFDSIKRAQLVQERVSTLREISLSTADRAAYEHSPLSRIAYSFVIKYVDQGTPELEKVLSKQAFDPKRAKELLPHLVERIDAGITPNTDQDMPSRRTTKVGLADVLNSAWFQKASVAVPPKTSEDQAALEAVRGQRNRLTLKAIEFAKLAEKHPPRQPRRRGGHQPPPTSGVLTAEDLHEWMERGPILERLIITPLFDAEQTIGTSAIDVRLGTEFILFRREAFHSLDISSADSLVGDVSRYQHRIVKRIKDPLVLHPGQLVIGSTLEYVQVPPTLMAYVVGKSTWGRTGLVIATATKVDPGFRGCITLEIINEGEIPLVLVPGIPIAQLVFHRAERPGEYRGSYTCPIGPEFPRFDSIVDGASFWLPSRRRR